MADALVPEKLSARSILDGCVDRFAAVDGDVRIEPLPLAQQLDVRVDTARASLDAIAEVLGAPLPGALSAATTPGGRTIVWLGPDEWLVIDPERSPDLEARLRDVVGDAGAVVDQSGQRLSLLVSGDAAGLLAKGTALDLSPAAFGEGAAVQGLLAQAIVILVARGPGSSPIELIVRTSFARYVADWLLDALEDPLAYPAVHGG